MNAPRRLLDLSRARRDTTPLLVVRPKNVPEKNVLSLKTATKSRALVFDLAEKKRVRDDGVSIHVPDTVVRPRFRRYATIALAAVLIIAIQFAGIFGSATQTVDRVIETAMRGVTELTGAGNAFAVGDFVLASESAALAFAAFRAAEEDLAVLGGAGAVLATKPADVQAGSRLVSAGRAVSLAGTHFAEAARLAEMLHETYTDRAALRLSGQSVTSAAGELSAIVRLFLLGVAELEQAATTVALVDARALPPELARRVAAAEAGLATVLRLTAPFADVLPLLPPSLGSDAPRRYLILFQNPDELRPTGGFIGNVATLTLRDGFVTEWDMRDVYDYDGQLLQLPAPDIFSSIAGSWGIRDSNTDPDFPTSAVQAAYLLEEAGGGSVDAVLAVNATALTRLVTALGGTVDVPTLGAVTADDLLLLLSLIIESKRDGAADPKQILRAMLPDLLSGATALSPLDLAMLAREVFVAGEVQLFFLDDRMQPLATALGIDGALQSLATDQLRLVRTSISGNKSDRYIRDRIVHETDIALDGTPTNRLTLFRTHSWDSTAEARIRALASRAGVHLDDTLFAIMGRGPHVDQLRIYVPAGAVLRTVSGVTSDRVWTTSEHGLTVIHVPLTTQPGSTREFSLSYTLPAVLGAAYELALDVQPGAPAMDVTKIIRHHGVERVRVRDWISAATTFSLESF